MKGEKKARGTACWILLTVLVLSIFPSACHTLVSEATQPTSSTPIVRFDPSPTQAYQGQTVTLRAVIYNVTDLNALDLLIVWNTSYLECESHNATLDCLNTPIFIVEDRVNATAGAYWLAATSLSWPDQGFDGSGEAFEITFTFLNLGATTVNFPYCTMSTPVGVVMPYVAVDASIFVTLGGDVDGNRQVDLFDIVLMAWGYGTSEGQPKFNANYDIDGDGDIDIFDLVIAAGNYGKSW